MPYPTTKEIQTMIISPSEGHDPNDLIDSAILKEIEDIGFVRRIRKLTLFPPEFLPSFAPSSRSRIYIAFEV
jgi:hypothetical protein